MSGSSRRINVGPGMPTVTKGNQQGAKPLRPRYVANIENANPRKSTRRQTVANTARIERERAQKRKAKAEKRKRAATEKAMDLARAQQEVWAQLRAAEGTLALAVPAPDFPSPPTCHGTIEALEDFLERFEEAEEAYDHTLRAVIACPCREVINMRDTARAAYLAVAKEADSEGMVAVQEAGFRYKMQMQDTRGKVAARWAVVEAAMEEAALAPAMNEVPFLVGLGDDVKQMLLNKRKELKSGVWVYAGLPAEQRGEEEEDEYDYEDNHWEEEKEKKEAEVVKDAAVSGEQKLDEDEEGKEKEKEKEEKEKEEKEEKEEEKEKEENVKLDEVKEVNVTEEGKQTSKAERKEEKKEEEEETVKREEVKEVNVKEEEEEGKQPTMEEIGQRGDHPLQDTTMARRSEARRRRSGKVSIIRAMMYEEIDESLTGWDFGTLHLERIRLYGSLQSKIDDFRISCDSWLRKQLAELHVPLQMADLGQSVEGWEVVAQLQLEMAELARSLDAISPFLWQTERMQLLEDLAGMDEDLADYVFVSEQVHQALLRAERAQSFTPPDYTAAHKARKAYRRKKVMAKRKERDVETIMEDRLLAQDDSDDEAVTDAEDLLFEAVAEVEEARKAVAAAALDVHATTLALLQAAPHYPEVMLDPQVAELAESRAVQQGRKLEHYTIHATLATEGQQGARHTVLLCSLVGEERKCVLKRFNLGALGNSRAKRRFLRELHVLQKARHPFVTCVDAVFFSDDSQYAYTEMEYFAEGDMAMWLAGEGRGEGGRGGERRRGRGRGEAETQRLLRKVLLGLAAVHEAGVIHGDIKPQNVFVDGDRAVLADFDVAREEASSAATACTRLGASGWYMAPELMFSDHMPSMASDMYAFGLMVFDAFFPPSVPGGKPRRDEVAVTVATKAPVTIPMHHNSDLVQLLVRCLALKPSQRLTAAEALAHPFFRCAARDAGEEGAGQLYGSVRVCFAGNDCVDREEMTLAEGIECSERQHFLCDTDLGMYVEMWCGVENIIAQSAHDGAVQCAETKCPGSYAAQDLALHMSPSAFSLVLDMQMRVTERRVALEQEAVFRSRLEVIEKEGAVGRHRRYVEEEILQLRCPRCRTAFFDFSGCFALKCSACPSHFCGWCMADCGSDAHVHVLTCSLKLSHLNYYGSAEDFALAQRKRKQKLLDTYLATVPVDLRAAVVKAIDHHLKHYELTGTA